MSLEERKNWISLILGMNGYTRDVTCGDENHMVFRKIIDQNAFVLLAIIDVQDVGVIELRGEFENAFDRWSNATYQRTFYGIDDFKQNWYRFWFWEENEYGNEEEEE